MGMKVVTDWIKYFRRMQQEQSFEKWLANRAQARFKYNYEEFLAENISEVSYLSLQDCSLANRQIQSLIDSRGSTVS